MKGWYTPTTRTMYEVCYVFLLSRDDSGTNLHTLLGIIVCYAFLSRDDSGTNLHTLLGIIKTTFSIHYLFKFNNKNTAWDLGRLKKKESRIPWHRL